MKRENDTIVLKFDSDFELINLILHIKKIGFGEFKLKIKDGKPYQLIDVQKSILLSQKVKNKEDYKD